MSKKPTYDKCQICLYVGKSKEFGDADNPECPNCGSSDINDISFNPYEDDTDDE